MIRLASQYQTNERSLVEIKELCPSELHAAAAILAHGMHDNPLHVRVFGANAVRRPARLLVFLGYLVAYVQSNGEVLGAYLEGELIGVLGVIKSGHCRPTLTDRLSFARAIVPSTPPTVLLRVFRWFSAWERNDPGDPHWHIGPLAVLPAYRRRGIGRRLMTRCCQRMDEFAATAWLETDLEINVGFYQRLGFVVVGYELVLGVPCWFMCRSPMGSTSVDVTARRRK